MAYDVAAVDGLYRLLDSARGRVTVDEAMSAAGEAVALAHRLDVEVGQLRRQLERAGGDVEPAPAVSEEASDG